MTEPTIVMRANVEIYVAAVGRRLSDLPEDDRVDLLEELRQHATSLCQDDPDVDLVQRLGSPVDYALELRDAAGLPATFGRRTLRERFGRLKTKRWWPVTVRLVRDMTPAWWALRGVAAALVFRFVFFSGMRATHFVIAAAIAAIGGWWIGPKVLGWSSISTWRRIVVIALNVSAAIVLSGAVLNSIPAEPTADVNYGVASPPYGLTNNGSSVTAIRAFTIDGKPIAVALFDQDGNPIDAAARSDQLTCPDFANELPVPYRTPGGRNLANVFPIRAVCVDATNTVVQPLATGSSVGASSPWTSDPLPLIGQRVTIDEDGNFGGLALTPGQTAGPSTSASPSR